jgi:hypothetical protein
MCPVERTLAISNCSYFLNILRDAGRIAFRLLLFPTIQAPYLVREPSPKVVGFKDDYEVSSCRE